MARSACDGKPVTSRLHNFQKFGRPAKINRDQAHQSYRCSSCGCRTTETLAVR